MLKGAQTMDAFAPNAGASRKQGARDETGFWIVLIVVLLMGALLEWTIEGSENATYLETTYGIADADAPASDSPVLVTDSK